jgi:hypothetical protein
MNQSTKIRSIFDVPGMSVGGPQQTCDYMNIITKPAKYRPSRRNRELLRHINEGEIMIHHVTIRIKVGSWEVECTGPKKWVERMIKKLIAELKKS